MFIHSTKKMIDIRKFWTSEKYWQNRIILDSLKITLIGILSKIIPFITFPLLAKIFSVEEIGQIDFILGLVLMATTVAILGQDSCMVRFYNLDRNEKRRTTLVSSIISTLFINSSLLCLIYYAITSIFGFQDVFGSNLSVVSILFLIVGFAWSSIIDALLRSRGDIRPYISYTIFYNMVVNLPVLWLYVTGRVNIAEYLFLYSVCVMFSGVIGLLYVKKYLAFGLLQICSVRLFKYGWPMMAVSAVALMQPLLERVLIKAMINDLELGIYSVSLKLVMLVQLPFTLLANALLIEIIKLSEKKDSESVAKKLIKAYTFFSATIFLIYILTIDYIALIIYDERYSGASVYATMLALGVYIYNVGGVYSSGLILAEKTHYKLTSAIIATILAIGLGYMLVPAIGVIAIPLAFIVSRCLSTIFEIKYSFVYSKGAIRNWTDVNVLSISAAILSLVVLLKITARH